MGSLVLHTPLHNLHLLSGKMAMKMMLLSLLLVGFIEAKSIGGEHDEVDIEPKGSTESPVPEPIDSNLAHEPNDLQLFFDTNVCSKGDMDNEDKDDTEIAAEPGRTRRAAPSAAMSDTEIMAKLNALRGKKIIRMSV